MSDGKQDPANMTPNEWAEAQMAFCSENWSIELGCLALKHHRKDALTYYRKWWQQNRRWPLAVVRRKFPGVTEEDMDSIKQLAFVPDSPGGSACPHAPSLMVRGQAPVPKTRIEEYHDLTDASRYDAGRYTPPLSP